MIIVNEKPPVFDECNKIFKLGKGTVFTYGNIIYNPDSVQIPDHLLIHEATHCKQQGYDEKEVRIWWDKYLSDPKFRVDQEIEAYNNQYKFICTKTKDKNARYKSLHTMAMMMCGEMYGRAISYTDAIRRIRNN